jgi:putative FmdB family regulatory protein
LYEYQCPKCGVFELIRKFSDEPVTACPTCGSEVQKLASAPAFHLKGTGWYVTDYAKKSGGDGKTGKDAKSSESKSGESKSSEGKSSESKSSESKSDSKGSKDSSTASPAATPSSKKSD